MFACGALHSILLTPETRPNVMRACFDALKPGGVLVSVSGTAKNVDKVHAAIINAVIHQGVPVEEARKVSPWFVRRLL